MTDARQYESPTADALAGADRQPIDTVGIEVEDFGLEFDSPNSSDNYAAKTRTDAPAQQSESPSADRRVSESGSRQERHFGDGETLLHIANGSIRPDNLILRLGMANWEKLKTLAGFQASSNSAGSMGRPIPDKLMDWANISWVISGVLTVVSVLGAYWGYSWFTGALLFLLAYLIGRGFAHVADWLSRIEAHLSSFTRGSNRHD